MFVVGFDFIIETAIIPSDEKDNDEPNFWRTEFSQRKH